MSAADLPGDTAATMTVAATEPAPLASAPPPPRLILGFAARDLALVAAFLSLTLWAIWATTALLELRQRRIVSVSLSTIIKDFVAAQARTAASPEIAAARTRAYLAATDAAMQSLSRDGTTVLVSEAVVGNSVPDMTRAVSAAVNAWLAKAPLELPAPSAAAAPPAAGTITGNGEAVSPLGASPFGPPTRSPTSPLPEAGDGL